MASVPVPVIGDPAIDRKAGTEAATDVTVPEPGGDVQATDPAPFVVRTWPLVPEPFGKVLEPMVTAALAVRKMLRAEVRTRSPKGADPMIPDVLRPLKVGEF